MRFFTLGSCMITAATIAVAVAVDNLFDPSLWDPLDDSQLILQDDYPLISQDSLSNLIFENSSNIPLNNDDLFSVSDPIDTASFSTINIDDLFSGSGPSASDTASTINFDDSSNLVASCQVQGGEQSLKLLRARDDGNSCVNSQHQPLQSGFDSDQ